MEKKYQIFVSSTLLDLQDERRAVIEAILNMGHIPIGMELFQAGNEEQWSYIKKRIDEADYYVVIVAERYGSTKNGVSYTEMEYDYATEKGVPVAAFLLREDMRAEWRKQKDGTDDRAAVEKFRRKCEGKMVRYWTNKDDLASSCVLSLMKIVNGYPRTGWVSANNAVSADLSNELARLSDENNNLRMRLEKSEKDSSGRMEEVKVDIILTELTSMSLDTDAWLEGQGRGAVKISELGDENQKIVRSDNIFRALCRDFVRGIKEQSVYDRIREIIFILLKERVGERDDSCVASISLYVCQDSVNHMIDYLMFNDCIESQARVTSEIFGRAPYNVLVLTRIGKMLANKLGCFGESNVKAKL